MTGTELGTGHAMMQAMLHVSDNADVLIVLGDVPLISLDTMRRLTESGADLSVLSVLLDDPTGYGRIVRDDAGQVRRIVEQRDADDIERALSMSSASRCSTIRLT